MWCTYKKYGFPLISVLLLLFIGGCQEDEIGSSANDILSVEIPHISSRIERSEDHINIVVGKNTDVSRLTLLIKVSEFATISPQSGVALDYSEPVIYKVTSESGLVKSYRVSVTKASFDLNKELLSFEFPNRKYIKEKIPNGFHFEFYGVVDIAKLEPKIMVSLGAKVSPLSGTILDFTIPQLFTITAEDGSDTTFLVSVSNNLSPKNEMIELKLETQQQIIEREGNTFNIYVPYELDVTGLPANLTISPNATVRPLSGEVQDFSMPVKYIVTSSDGSVADYIVHVKKSSWKCLLKNGESPFKKVDGHRIVVFNDYLWLLGGWTGRFLHEYGEEYTSQVWRTKDGITWENMGDAPWSGRHGFGCVVHDNKLWVLGGDANRDVWNTSDGITWNLVNDNVPYGDRYFPYYATFNDRIYMIGGVANDWAMIRFGDVWSSHDGVTWTQETTATAFADRGLISGSVVFNDELYIIGGGVIGSPNEVRAMEYNDVWKSSDAKTWQMVLKEGPFKPLYWHSIGVHNSQMYVAQGFYRGHIHNNDVWYSADGKNWQRSKYAFWEPRHAASFASFEGKLYMVGGTINPAYDLDVQNDVWVMDGDF